LRLTGNELAIEIRQIPADDANKLVQTGQSGQKVSINFFEAEATMVLRTLAEISGKNVMIDPSLSGRRITVTLDNIPYDQALEIVMAQVGASMRVSDAIVLFGDRAVLQKRDQDRADDLAKAADIAPLVSETFELSYLKAADVETLITSAPSAQAATNNAPATPGQPAPAQGATNSIAGKGMLSARGSISKHEPTNLLFVRDTEDRIAAIRQVIKAVDVPAKQVMIEARIVRADTTFSRNLGVRLGFNDLRNTVGKGVGTRIPGTDGYVAFGTTSAGLQSGTGQTIGGGVAPTTPFQGPSINLPVAGNTFAVSVFDASLTKFLNLELQAAEAEGKSVNIASPRVVTANNLEAKISQGQKIPYSTASSQGTNTQFIDAVLSLSAKPQIAPNGTVILELKVKNDAAGSGSPPPINTSELNTKVTVENGGTVVLGGVILEESTITENRIPVLGDIPYLGNLFKSNEKITRKGELLVFITPRILNDLASVSTR
jgi:type IV pilus assembly protein PilQ